MANACLFYDCFGLPAPVRAYIVVSPHSHDHERACLINFSGAAQLVASELTLAIEEDEESQASGNA